MTDAVARLWLRGLPPSEVLTAPAPVLGRALHLLNKKTTQEADDAAWQRLHEQLRSGG